MDVSFNGHFSCIVDDSSPLRVLLYRLIFCFLSSYIIYIGLVSHLELLIYRSFFPFATTVAPPVELEYYSFRFKI
jgi:hypothetical protein